MISVLRKIFPAPLLSAALAVLWLVLNKSLAPAHIFMAIILGIVVPLFTAPLRPTPVKVHHFWLGFKLFWLVGLDVIVSNLQVAKGAMRFGKTKPSGDFIRVPLELRNPNGLAALAAICTVIPGTIWSELALDRSAVLIHVFDLRDPEAEMARFKNRYEMPLLEIFE